MLKNTIKYILILSAAFALSGCGIYGKFENRVDTDIREDAYGVDYTAPQDDTLGLASLQWKEMFTDTLLQNIIEIGLENNSNLKVASLQCEEALATLKASKLAYIPSFDASLGGTVAGSVEHGGETWGWSLPLNASWQIDIFGSLTNAKRRAAALVEGSEAYEQAVRSQLIATIATTYYSLVALDAQYAIYLETEHNWKESLKTTKRLMEAGTYNMAAVAQTEANYYGVKASLVDMQTSIREVENSLCSLLGIPSGHIARASLSGWNEPEVISAGIPAIALANRPDVMQAESAYKAAFYGTNQARSNMYPSLRITGTLNFAELLYNAAASLLAPIFQNGQLTAQLKIAKAQQEEAAIQFSQAIIDAGIEVNNLMTGINGAKEKGEYYALQQDALETAVKSTTSLMEHGSTTYLEILTAQTSLLNAQISVIANKLDEINGVISLYQALGGGKE